MLHARLFIRELAGVEGLGQACVVTCLMHQRWARCSLENRLYSGLWGDLLVVRSGQRSVSL